MNGSTVQVTGYTMYYISSITAQQTREIQWMTITNNLQEVHTCSEKHLTKAIFIIIIIIQTCQVIRNDKISAEDKQTTWPLAHMHRITSETQYSQSRWNRNKSKDFSRLLVVFSTTEIVSMKYALYHKTQCNNNIEMINSWQTACHQLILDSWPKMFTHKTLATVTKCYFQGLQLKTRGLFMYFQGRWISVTEMKHFQGYLRNAPEVTSENIQ